MPPWHSTGSVRIIGLLILIVPGAFPAQEFNPDIPRAWDDNAVRDLELPLVHRDRSGFKAPDDLRKSLDILDLLAGTDPVLATQTRRGTGFNKIPSLRGVWFRNGFGHAGAADTLDEWFDQARLKEDYMPRGYYRGPDPIQGHEFGLKISPGDKQALIAFLKTS
jgi:hypothetical protein